ncbi:MAG: hypothetical protein GXO90_05425 [FCB group bacterium]|nr:hypothetical protein [FCB group bacterium]
MLKQISITIIGALILLTGCSSKEAKKGRLTFVTSANVRAQFDPCG